GRSLSIDNTALFADVGGAQNAQPFRVRRHDAILDSVVNHLDEVTRSVRSTMQVALLGGAADLLSTRSAWNISHSGSERGEDWIEPLDDIFFTANHHAVASLETPDASARADVYIVDPGSQFFSAPNVIHVVRITTVDQHIALVKVRQNVCDGL